MIIKNFSSNFYTIRRTKLLFKNNVLRFLRIYTNKHHFQLIVSLCTLFSVSTAENLNVDDSVASLITAGTALHWFEHAQFYKECDRVLVPGGVVAAYCYDPSGVVASNAPMLQKYLLY